MAVLRLLTLCTVVSTALSFVAMAPRGAPMPVSQSSSRARVVTTPWGARSGRLATASNAGSMRMAMERTYIMIKPDGVQRGLVADIIGRFEKRGYKLVALKLTRPAASVLQEHYEGLKDKPFFPKLIEYMTSGPVVAMVWEGKEVVSIGRKMLGQTNPLASEPGTIRGDFCIEVGRNICHGSDSVESAEREIKLWFKDGEVQDWAHHSHDWIYE